MAEDKKPYIVAKIGMLFIRDERNGTVKVLLGRIQQAGQDFPALWQLPLCLCKPGESFEQALVGHVQRVMNLRLDSKEFSLSDILESFEPPEHIQHVPHVHSGDEVVFAVYSYEPFGKRLETIQARVDAGLAKWVDFPTLAKAENMAFPETTKKVLRELFGKE